jgi:hypothetical protein
MTNLTHRTTIPLFAALASIPLLIGGILWLTSIDAKAERALDQNINLKETVLTVSSEIKEMRDSLKRVEIKLGTYPTRKGE